jgi:hypothetical protein
MHEQIDSIRKTRAYLLELISDLTAEEMNKIPEGFNNNIIWNLGHMVAAQQGISYVRAGLQPKVAASFMAAYKPGTKPEGTVDEARIAQIKSLLFATLDVLAQDYNASLWQQYPAWQTRYGVTIDSIESAVSFLLFHEGLHSGIIMAQKRVIEQRTTAA